MGNFHTLKQWSVTCVILHVLMWKLVLAASDVSQRESFACGKQQQQGSWKAAAAAAAVKRRSLCLRRSVNLLWLEATDKSLTETESHRSLSLSSLHQDNDGLWFVSSSWEVSLGHFTIPIHIFGEWGILDHTGYVKGAHSVAILLKWNILSVAS